jgi:ABC-2 type transport system ATP-binding protein
LKGLSKKAARQRAYELLERYGLKDFANSPTESLSKGMGQKVQVLASIAHDPEFVILDEPFSGLDPVNQQVMEDIIRDMAKRGRTVLFSTHVMQHAERLCDRILLLAKGRKIFDGTIGEAKETIPRRVRIETEDDIAALRELKRCGGRPAIGNDEQRAESDHRHALGAGTARSRRSAGHFADLFCAGHPAAQFQSI